MRERPWATAAAAASVAAFAVLLCLTRVRDADTWWHLKAGELILRSGIPRTDPFSYVLDGRPWVAFEWLSQVLFFLAYRAGGAAGLTALKSAVVAGALLLIWRLNSRRPLWSMLATCAAALTIQWSFVERPWIFDQAMLGATLGLLWDGFDRGPSAAARWGLPALTALWANLHGAGAALAPALIGIGLAATALRGPPPAWRAWAATLALSAAALWATPSGWGLFEQAWRTLTYPGKERIRDWAPSWDQVPGPYGAFLAAGLAAAWRLRRERPAAAAWILLLAASSLRMYRNIPLFVLAAAPAAAAAWEPPWLAGGGARELALCLALAAAAAGADARLHPYLRTKRGVGTWEPLAGAAAFVRDEGLTGRMFNEYEWGGYLIWSLGPGRKVFLDGRNAEYDPGLLAAGLTWFRPASWKALDERFGFQYAVVARHAAGAYTTKVLDELPEWKLVYWDDEAMVYLRRSPPSEPPLRRFAYEHLQPGRSNHQYLDPLIERGKGPKLLAELGRAARECRRGGINARLLRAYVLARLGRFHEAEASAREAAVLAPERAQPRLTLGWVRLGADDLAGARAAYEEGLRLVLREERATLGSDLSNNLGRVYERQGERALAARAYRQALRWNPGRADAFENLRRLE